MNGPQTRRSPRGGAGFEVDQQIGFAQQLYGTSEAAARAGYAGTTPPRTPPTARHYADTARDLADAAGRLRAIAGGIRLGGPTPETIADADRIVTGCGALLRELRQGAP